MQFQSDAATLAARAAIAAEASSRDLRMAAVRLSTAKRHIKLACRSETGEAVIQCPAEVSDSGSATVPAKLFAKVASAAPAGDTTVTGDDTGVKVAANGNEWDIRSVEQATLDLIGRSEDTVDLTVPASELSEAHQIVGPCVASPDETREGFTAMELQAGGNEGLRLTATDGTRIAIVTGPAGEDAADSDRIIVALNPKLLAAASKHAPADSDIRLRVAELGTKINFPFGDGTAAECRLIHNQVAFPDWSKVVNAAAGKKDSRRLRIEVATAELRAAIDRVSLFATSAYPTMRLEYENGRLRLSCHDQEIGDSESRIGCQASDELEGASVYLNPKNLAYMAKSCTQETFHLTATNPPADMACLWHTKFETLTGGIAFMGLMSQRVTSQNVA